jgi:hypothetical protein
MEDTYLCCVDGIVYVIIKQQQDAKPQRLLFEFMPLSFIIHCQLFSNNMVLGLITAQISSEKP